MANDLFNVLATDAFSFGTKRAVVEQVLADWPEWYGKHDRPVRGRTWPMAKNARDEANAIARQSAERPLAGCPFWSAGALKAYSASQPRDVYRFEHVVPRSVVRDFLLGQSPAAKQSDASPAAPPYRFTSVPEAKEFLDRVCIGAVILKSEDAWLARSSIEGSLHDWRSLDPWSRYRRAAKDGRSITIVNLMDGSTVV
ncbi:hypothetical protein [Caballeronia concitans]|uniref:Uncharacterized protein n=1 Tax=Caballeronia concitans TaxID=1777133 RepID=A0A658R4J7_9BURK|nr:hypothetical protein [Caballeronia concitans]SAL49393.1 hypothetical protein AWB72_05163 [Caballeronia concitans]